MNLGSLSEKHLEKVIRKSRLANNLNMETGPGIGNDFSRVGEIVTADGTADTVELAWYKAWGNFTCSLGKCMGARLVSLLPESCKESKIVEYTEAAAGLALEHNAAFLGGHTEVTREVSVPLFCITLIGAAGKWRPQKGKIQPGDDIVMIGYAGQCGIRQVLLENRKEPAEHFSQAFLEQAKCQNGMHCSDKLLDILELDDESPQGIWYLHDISCGGVYGALWQLGCWTGRGLLVENKAIPVKQSTIEICECLDLNPYLLDGTGGMLLVCRHEMRLAERLQALGVEANRIGRITEEKERLVRLGPDDIRTLSPVTGDEVKNKI